MHQIMKAFELFQRRLIGTAFTVAMTLASAVFYSTKWSTNWRVLLDQTPEPPRNWTTTDGAGRIANCLDVLRDITR